MFRKITYTLIDDGYWFRKIVHGSQHSCINGSEVLKQNMRPVGGAVFAFAVTIRAAERWRKSGSRLPKANGLYGFQPKWLRKMMNMVIMIMMMWRLVDDRRRNNRPCLRNEFLVFHTDTDRRTNACNTIQSAVPAAIRRNTPYLSDCSGVGNPEYIYTCYLLFFMDLRAF